LVIDQTALSKKWRHSVGVAPQYSSSLDKTSNSQSLVSVTLASVEAPESWTNDLDRITRSRITKEWQVAKSKPEIAIEEIDRVIASGVRFGCVLADAG
jgi:SRSO17 transposase